MRLAAAVVAGGRSTRMGREKAMLPAHGHAHLLARQIAILKTIRPREILLSCRKNQFRFTIPGVRQIHDDGQRGPLGGLAALLESSQSEFVFVLAVDLPVISGTLIRKIASRAGRHDGTGLVPRGGGRIEPLAAIYPATMLDLVRDRLEKATDFSMRSLVMEAADLGLLTWYEIREHEKPEFSNWNQPSSCLTEAALPAGET